MKNKNPIFSNLTDIFNNKFGKKSLIGNKLSKQIFDYDRSLKPNFPRQIQIETTNICNHGCTFDLL